MRFALVMLAASSTGCVAHVGLDDAPCPCGPGYTCCNTLALCVREGAICPASLPPSTNKACMTDDQCGGGELCAAWRVGDPPNATYYGPRSCRRTCSNSTSCDAEESCLLSLHGGTSIDLLQAAHLCLPSRPEPGCEGWTCSGCGSLELGGISDCSNSQVEACTFAIRPTCGIKCALSVVGACNGIAPLCEQDSCGRCPGGTATGSQCLGDEVEVCLASKAPATESCAQICVTATVAQCARGCVSSGAEGATCAL
jgi:hypothetical protein